MLILSPAPNSLRPWKGWPVTTDMTNNDGVQDEKTPAEGPSRAQRRGPAIGFALGAVLGLASGIAAGMLVREQCESLEYFGRLMALVVLGGIGFFAGSVLGAILGKRLSGGRGKP